jgi:hypothetical protein
MGESLVPDAETRSFVFASFDWLLSGSGGLARFVEQTELVTPTLHDFPVDLELEGRELALDYFGFVREHARVDPDLRVELVPGRRPLGSLTDDRGDPLPIGYSEEAVDDPELLIAYAARGLHHYAIQTHPRSPPGGWAMIGEAAELAALFAGFGIFLTNTAYALPDEDGLVRWPPRQRWVLSERALAYALAVFGWVKEIPDLSIISYLRPNPRAFYRAAVRDLRRRGAELGELRGTLRLPHQGPYR